MAAVVISDNTSCSTVGFYYAVKMALTNLGVVFGVTGNTSYTCRTFDIGFGNGEVFYCGTAGYSKQANISAAFIIDV